ncbi:MAG TPA: hypothetical protein VG266_12110, partial [Candidatus Dormibacteraeota bacterium]|nr:hypothetical protein [Candidatus Dormibacteraeota bacterium]
MRLYETSDEAATAGLQYAMYPWEGKTSRIFRVSEMLDSVEIRDEEAGTCVGRGRTIDDAITAA